MSPTSPRETTVTSGRRDVKPTIGWREWVALPMLGVAAVKVKVDTGARTSALHAFDIEHVTRRGIEYVRFNVHPLQRDAHTTVACEAEIVDKRVVRSSAGHEQERLVIRSHVELQGQIWPIEVTLTRRDAMGFRMLLGRQAVRGHFLVDPGRSFLGGRPPGAPPRVKARRKAGRGSQRAPKGGRRAGGA